MKPGIIHYKLKMSQLLYDQLSKRSEPCVHFAAYTVSAMPHPTETGFYIKDYYY